MGNRPVNNQVQGVQLLLEYLEELLVLAQPLGGIHGVQARHRGPIGIPVLPEGQRIRYKQLDVLQQGALESNLQQCSRLQI